MTVCMYRDIYIQECEFERKVMVRKKRPKTKGLQSATQVLLLCCVDTCAHGVEGSELLRAGKARTSCSILGKGKKLPSFPKRLYRLWGALPGSSSKSASCYFPSDKAVGVFS